MGWVRLEGEKGGEGDRGKECSTYGEEGGGERGMQYILNFKKGQYIRWVKIKGREHRQYI